MNNFSFNQRAKLIRFLCSLTLLIYSAALQAMQQQQQQQNITGRVTDSNGTLQGVTVLVRGISSGTLTDENGKFSLKANTSDVLVFSYMGYKTVEVTIANQLEINVELEEDTTLLSEVVVNAGYYSVKDKERTGSISRITAKDIETQPVTNVLATMQGRMAGVNITQETGIPGGGFAIQIRGINSLRSGGNAPLYVIDGVPYASESIGSNFTSIYPTQTTPLNSINPESIESIEILKDADATAIYGSRGANGVVLITTKKGKIGTTKVNVSTSKGVGQVTRFMKLMNTEQYLNMRAKAYQNDGFTDFPDWAYDINGTWNQDRYTDWQKELLGGSAIINSYFGTVSGGSQQTQFIVGANYNNQSTVFPGNFMYRKGGANFNINHKSENNRFKLTFSGNYTSQNNNQPAMDLTIESRRLSPNAPALYDAQGNLNWENSTWVNPLASLKSEFIAKTNDLVSNTLISYELMPSLEIKSSFGYTDTRNTETRTVPSTIYNPAFGLGPEYSSLFVNNTNRNSWIIEPQINWKGKLSKGNLEVLLGATFQKQVSNRLTQYGIGFTSNSLIYDLNSASLKNVVANDEIVYKYQAFFGRINYNWDKKYLLNFTGRRDGSSRFGPGNQFATFGAIGAAWIVSKENWLQDNNTISFAKWRVSYGTTGNDQIGDYQYLDTYTSGGLYQGIVGLQPTRLLNPYFEWEKNKKMETALEIGLLEDKVFITAAYFQNRSSNQLVGIPLPGTTGFTSMQANLNAEVQNTGIEFTVNTTNISNDNFSWKSSFNISVPKNKLIAFPGLQNSVYKEQFRIGEPLNIQLAYNFLGVDPETGLYQFEDVNGDGQITFPDDKQSVVDLSPEFFGGLQNQVTYKRWTLDFLFQFIKQKRASFTLGNAGGMNNQPVELVNSWQNPGDSSPYQVYTIGSNSNAVAAHSFFESSTGAFEDGSFIRLKTLLLSYNIPLNSKKIDCKISAQAQNLLTFTKYKGGDPEFGLLGYLPPLRIITSGIQLTF
jgi:TonB-dependent starch-binding outer membrane protein SusC